MAEEFVIKSTTLEDKINQLLPSQGGFEAGVDLSASSMIVPIIDLTESAEGSNIRADLQSAMSLNSITSFAVSSATSTLINTTGYFRVFGYLNCLGNSVVTVGSFDMTDGTTSKRITQFAGIANSTDKVNMIIPFDFIVFLEAGHSLSLTSTDSNSSFVGNTRQLADLSGNLVNP